VRTALWVDALSRELGRFSRRGLALRTGEQRAAVLVPIVDVEDEEPFLILERRADGLPSHAGQYAFPGGGVEDCDGSRAETALRETREEIGLDLERVRVLGPLPDIRTPTGYVISPILSVVKGPVELSPSPEEVAFLVEPPVSVILDPSAFRMVTRRARRLLIHGEALVWHGHVIWGATARMLLALRRLLRATPGPWNGVGEKEEDRS